MIVSIVLFAIFFVCVGMLVREGMWSNALTLFNVVTAALLATATWEPLADRIDDMMPTFTYLADFLAFWIAFCVSVLIFRALTDLLSKSRVRFKRPVELGGGIFFAIWVGWVMVCFTAMTLHTAPLARNFMRGGFYETTDDKIFFGMLAPDRQWLAFTQKVSRGSLSASPPSEAQGEDGRHVFDPRGEFIIKYGQRRANFEKQEAIRVERR